MALPKILGWKLRGARGGAVAEATVPVREVLPVLETVQEFGSQLSRIEIKLDALLLAAHGEEATG